MNSPKSAASQCPLCSPLCQASTPVISSHTCSLDGMAQVAVTSLSGPGNEGKDKDRGVHLIPKPQVRLPRAYSSSAGYRPQAKNGLLHIFDNGKVKRIVFPRPVENHQIQIAETRKQAPSAQPHSSVSPGATCTTQQRAPTVVPEPHGL